MPVLDRQGPRAATPAATPDAPRPAAAAGAHPVARPATALPPSLQGLPARSVPEVAPTPLQRHYINLSVIVLVCGAVAITALNLGARLGDPLIKLCVIVATPLLVVTTGDAIVRIARSARAWMPVDAGRAWFRVAWVVVSVIGLGALVAAAIAVLLA